MLKNVLNVPAGILSRDIVLWIVIYGGFFVTLNFNEEKAPQKEATPRKAYDRRGVWSAIIIGITLAIIGLYTFR